METKCVKHDLMYCQECNYQQKDASLSESKLSDLLCCGCGKSLGDEKHTIYKHWENPDRKDYCCKCYIADGGAPVDWHVGCMEIYGKIKAT